MAKIGVIGFKITEEDDRMKLKDKLKLIEEIEMRNRHRIKLFLSKKRKAVSSGFAEKADGNRNTPEKPQ